MALYRFFDPTMFGIELVYTLIVVFLCFLVYYKTKDLYELTKYKGIAFFRNAFLFFGLAYASRFVLYIIQLTHIAFDIIIPRGMFFPVVMVPTGYLSTMAIFYLAYSTIWKKIKYKYFIVFSNIVAIIVSAIAFISRSPILLSIIQLPLLVFTVVLTSRRHKKAKKKSNTRTLYLLISIFWLMNLFVLSPRRFIPFEIKIVLQAISLIVFIAIYYKVTKWIKWIEKEIV